MQRQVSRGGSSRRKTIWIRNSVNLTTDTNGFVYFNPLIDIGNSNINLLGCTVTRIRGMIGSSDTTLSGIGILAFQVSGSSLPPVAADRPSITVNRERDWMGWVNFGIDLTTRDTQFTEFDIKAQRRMDELGMNLYGYVDVGASLGVNPVAIVTSVLITTS